MRVALVPYDITWEDPQQNLNRLEEMLRSKSQEADLYILPEMFNSGFSMRPEAFAESMDGPTIDWMRRMAVRLDAGITGSIAVRTDEGMRNRMLFVQPEGRVDWYDKRHLFGYSGEDKAYIPGKERVIVEFRGWRILLQVCYDLRFPVFARNRMDYDMILYVANWPSPRAHHWEALAKARAIENQCYVAAVNRTGEDGNGLKYSGCSLLYRFDGTELLRTDDANGLFFEVLSLEQQLQYQQSFPFLRDADRFNILE